MPRTYNKLERYVPKAFQQALADEGSAITSSVLWRRWIVSPKAGACAPHAVPSRRAPATRTRKAPRCATRSRGAAVVRGWTRFREVWTAWDAGPAAQRPLSNPNGPPEQLQ